MSAVQQVTFFRPPMSSPIRLFNHLGPGMVTNIDGVEQKKLFQNHGDKKHDYFNHHLFFGYSKRHLLENEAVIFFPTPGGRFKPPGSLCRCTLEGPDLHLGRSI